MRAAIAFPAVHLALRVADPEALELGLDGSDLRGWITRRTGSAAEAFEEVTRMREPASYVRGEAEEAWAILFVVPDDWGDLSVRIENVEPREGQPHAAIVPLGS